MQSIPRLINLISLLSILACVGCSTPSHDSRVAILNTSLRRNFDNIQAFSLRNENQMLRAQVTGHNTSARSKKIQYKIEWFDAAGFRIPSKQSNWLDLTAIGHADFIIQGIAPTSTASSFKAQIRENNQ